jgi:hypothetical protein
MPTKPSSRIRRFDVFADYRKQEEQDGERPSAPKARPGPRRTWHVLSGEAQTDQLFHHEVAERRGQISIETSSLPLFAAHATKRDVRIDA